MRPPSFLAGLLPLLLTGCPFERVTPSAGPVSTNAPLRGAVYGCVEISGTGTCLYTPGDSLKVWVEASARDVQVAADGDPIATTAEAVDSGFRVVVPLPGAHQQLVVRTRNGLFRLPLNAVEGGDPRPADRAQAFETFRQAKALLGKGEAKASYALLKTVAGFAEANDDAHLRHEVIGPLTFVEVVQLGELAAAEARLAKLPAPPAVDGRARSIDQWARGVLARRLRDYRTAQAALTESVRWGLRVDYQGWLASENERGQLLIDAGRAKEAVRIFDGLAQAQGRRACERARVNANAGWARLMTGDPALIAAGEPLLRQGLEGFEVACPSEVSANNQRVNLALARLELDDPEGAAAWLAQMHGDEGPVVPFWKDLLAARIEVASGRSAPAAAAFEKLARRAIRARVFELAWLAEMGAAKAYRAAGDLDSAIAHFEAAEAVVVRNSMLLPVHAGRFELIARRADSAAALVDALIASKRIPTAFEAARRARRRGWRTLSAQTRLDNLSGNARTVWAERIGEFERARRALEAFQGDLWARPPDEQARDAAQERVLVERVDRAMDAALEVIGTTSQDVSPRAPVLPNDQLVLLPFEGRLFVGRAGAVSVQASDALEAWVAVARASPGLAIQLLARRPEDAVALARQLGPQRAVTFGFDLGPSKAKAGDPALLIVSDPRGDLADARAETKAVSAAYGDGAEVRVLAGRAASRSAVRDQLRSATILHYAGHGRRAGLNGWDSALLLADSELKVSDILLAPAVPRIVVLSSCEGAKSGDGETPGIGLAQAFLVAGADAVVATHQAIESTVSRAFAEAFHVELARARPRGVRDAFGRAVQRLASAERPTDAFLLMVR